MQVLKQIAAGIGIAAAAVVFVAASVAFWHFLFWFMDFLQRKFPVAGGF
jgi:hypothetical protein